MNSEDRLAEIKSHLDAIAAAGDYGKIVGALSAASAALPVARGDQGNAEIESAEGTVRAAVAVYVSALAPFIS